MQMKDTHSVKCQSPRETENAILLEFEDGTKAWIPFSQIDHIIREPNGLDVEVTMSRWIAQQKGLL